MYVGDKVWGSKWALWKWYGLQGMGSRYECMWQGVGQQVDLQGIYNLGVGVWQGMGVGGRAWGKE